MADFKVYAGDCMDIINDLDGIDAVITDPPYGQNYNPGNRPDTRKRRMKGIELQERGWEQIVGESQPFDPAPLLRFPVVCLWGANHYADKLPASSGWFIWDKRCGMPSNDQSDCEMAWTNRNRAARIYRQMWNGIIRQGRENIARAGGKLHPHQKPEALMGWCIYQLDLRPGMTVLDPYMGSGTTGVMCLEAGINFVGCEIDHGYYELAEKRLKIAQRRIPLQRPAQVEPWVQSEMFD